MMGCFGGLIAIVVCFGFVDCGLRFVGLVVWLVDLVFVYFAASCL